MSPAEFPLPRFLSLVLITLVTGPVACAPPVSRFDMESAQSQVDTARSQLAKYDQEVSDLRNELKELKSFGGPEHQKKLQAALALRTEKTELDGLKKDLDGRLEHFEKEAARHREALAKMKQQP
jgi:outer membrane protein TolC